MCLNGDVVRSTTQAKTKSATCDLKLTESVHVYCGDALVFSTSGDGRVAFSPGDVDRAIAILSLVLKFLKVVQGGKKKSARLMGRGAIGVLLFLAMAGAAQAAGVADSDAQNWWDGWRFLIALLGSAILVMQLLSYFRRKPSIDVDFASMAAKYLSINAFDQHRAARDAEINGIRESFGDMIDRHFQRAEQKIDMLRLETKQDIQGLQKKISIEVAGVHDRVNAVAETLGELRGRQLGKD